MQWVCVADLQNEGIHPRFCTEKGSVATTSLAVKGELQTMDGKKEREAVLTEMGHEEGPCSSSGMAAGRQKKAGEGPRGKDE